MMERDIIGIETVLSDSCMLVSDSNEVGNQLESKQLGYGTLTDMAENNLFKKYFDMSKYLTKNQYDVYKGMLENRKNDLSMLKSEMESEIFDQNKETLVNHQPLLRVVDG